MRILIQRVRRASVGIGGSVRSSIGRGLLVLVGIGPDDGEDDVRYLCEKLVKLRIFDDEAGVMNRSVVDAGGDVLVVSQFTLYASTRKGNRPSYVRAAGPEAAGPLYERFVAVTGKLLGRPVQTGVFGADMQVELVNDGPVTIWIDSKRKEY
ncbi:D-aminoacyl-tRNA deacylase [Alistipes ihumii]|uniref:D-aminoacyl-tRNA deacylase n=1 Tax=Alistipes ihumii TaxID=1470347 RepID=UPI003AB63192